MLPFPFALMTWRECVVGFEPTEMVHMQVERNYVRFGARGSDPIGNGAAVGENRGFVNWRMKEEFRDGKRLRMLHSESYDLKAKELRIEEIWVDPATNAIAFQNEQRTTPSGNERSECAYFPDRVESKRTLLNGKVVTAAMIPADGMAAVQRRFTPLGAEPKEFLMVDGIRGTFRKIRIEPAGRFKGNWGTDKFEGSAYRYRVDGQSYVVMLSPANEVVKVEFTKDVSLVLMGQPKSKRYEDNLPNKATDVKVKTVPTKGTAVGSGS